MNKSIWHNIAMQWIKISKKEILENYNNGKIINPNDLSSFAKLYKPNENYILIMMTRKTKTPNKPPQWFVSYMDAFRKEMSQMMDKKLQAFAKLNELKYE